MDEKQVARTTGSPAPDRRSDGSVARTRPRVVVVGAGFGGLELAKALRKISVDILLIDRNNYHTFQPLLYQVATAALEADEIAETVRGILRSQRNFDFRLGTVTGVDWTRNAVMLEGNTSVPFDYLVLAAGASTNTFGIDGVEEHAFELKTLDDSIQIRNHIIKQFERASTEPDTIAEGALNFVVVGGGPTGVETSGALRELFRHVLRKDFPGVDVERARVLLVEATSELLSPFHEGLRAYSVRALQKRGVEVLLGHSVERVSESEVVVRDPEGGVVRIPTGTVIWSAGVRANRLADVLGLKQARGGRIEVEADLSTPARGNVFVIGDMAAATNENGTAYPQLAPVAIQAARHTAGTIRRRLEGQPGLPFRYRDKGIMATIGRGAAVAQLPGGLKLRGWLAWHAWALIHLTQIVGLRNKLYVYANWVYNYVTYDRRARLVLEPPSAKRDDENSA